MLAAILGFLTALFNNTGDIIRQIRNLFRVNVEKAKEETDKKAGEETKSRDQGGRPQWDE